mgnify:FL=1
MLLSSGSHTRSISIHAPAGGATNHPDGERQEADFNSRPCGRGDGGKFDAQKMQTVFQFTPLREGRLNLLFHSWQPGKFQFTPLREGRPRHREQP